MLSMGLIDMFFFHLNKEPPADFSRATYEKTPDADRAFMSLLGLSKISNFLRDGHPYEQQMVDDWPGAFKWSVYLVAGRVQSPEATPQSKRSTLDVITAAWYSISRTDPVRNIMAATPGTVEVATQLWINEDSRNMAASTAGLPTASACLDALLSDGVGDCLDRVVKAGGGNADSIAQLAVSRLKTAINNAQMNHTAIVIYLDLIGHLCRKPRHPLRHAFLNLNIIPMFTKIALNALKMLNERAPDIMLDVMVSSMCFMFNCLESTDGFTWVIQAVNAGLLTAWVDSSPYFHRLHPEDRDTVVSIIRDIVPRYLVYRSVINAINGAMSKLDDESFPHKNRVFGSTVRDVWIDFHKQCLERLLVSIHAKAIKGKAVTCDNVKCQKVDAKNNFQKCSSCGTTLYCSKGYQKVAWKEGGHKDMCKMKQQERKEGKLQSITKSDAAFFHDLATRDARHHLPYLHRLARSEYPKIKDSGFIIYIDYTILPAKFSLKPLADYERNMPASLDGSSNAEARNEAFVKRARENPGKFMLIQSQLSNGIGVQLVTSVVTADFWNSETWDFPLHPSLVNNDGNSLDDEAYDTNVDSVDIMKARMILNQFAKSVTGGEETLF
ncbi:uncharacterized protein EV420DRAFT_1495591 [Desarmillaria tabescens]|uniref:MYND-type domain-containing protein n=1 Tax=Armillaria tabescens TaxID=1929756 RepID=A0AA39NQ78_ARMTA|nr:uncharacterized protein EV420DRAFT_1495591 [Desarmillaria tabescens]KAK0469609.1 hypothetical protein EV420DRAFT_1495591 [Desarmillaria tabescens]